MNKIFFFTIILLIYKIKNNNVFRIPFKTRPYQSQSSSNINSYILSLIHNDIYISLEIGSPSQEIISFLKFEEFPFFISGTSISSSQYDETKSSTFKSELYPHVFLEGKEKIKWGLVSNDTFKIFNNQKSQKEKIDLINFVLVTETRTDSLSNIGLMIPNVYSSIPDISFIYQLKKQKIINEYNFMINYTDITKGEGEFIIGSCPHIFEKEKYDIKNYVTNNAIQKPNYMVYGLIFDNIFYGKNKDNTIGKGSGIFLCDFGLIIGSNSFYDIIYKNFFQKKISEKICFNASVTTTIEWREGEKEYEYFYCDKKLLKEQDMANIGQIEFEQKEMNYTFEFNYKELFLEKNEFYFFQVIFNHKNNFYWIFGKPWFVKYLMVFNQDSKTIGHYYIHGYNSQENNKSKINWILLSIILLLVLFIIIFGGWMIYYYKREKRKKRINEIKDEFDYTQEGDNKTDNLINNNLNNKSLGINE